MERLSYEEFKNIVKMKVEEIVEDSPFVASVELKTVTAPMGNCYEGILINTIDNCSPIFDVSHFYDQYTGENLDFLLDSLRNLVTEGIMDRPRVNTEDLLSKDYFKEHLIGQVVNSAWNEGELENVPHRNCEDLALVYRIAIETDESPIMGTILVSNMIAEKVGYSEDELFDIAKANIEKGMILESFNGMIGMFLTEGEGNASRDWKLCLSKDYKYGASVIMCEEKLQAIREEIGDFYIIPSSIHELILMPKSCVSSDMDIQTLCSIIEEVNDSMDPKEVLSNHPYLYTEEGLSSVFAD